jgi:hypothetical protein
MKSIQKVTRVKLNINRCSDCVMFGLVSTDPDYKLSLTLNKKFGLSLKNISAVKFTDDTGYELSFSRFSDTVSSPETIFNLISNRSGKYYLLKKLKNVDYILHIQELDNETDLNLFTTSLRDIESITAVFNIDIMTLRDKNLKYLTH